MNQIPGQTVIYEHIPHARTTDPHTSHAAATPRAAPKMIEVLLKVFATYGILTAEQACDLAGYTAADGGWKRVSDLTRMGYVAPTGNTTEGSSGRQQQLLRVTTEGLDAAI